MKLSTAVLLALSAPSLAWALIGADWSFTEAPASGLDDVTFGFNMANAPRRSGFYFAQEYAFYNVDQLAYCGVQPRELNDGVEIVHGVFSTFQGGSTTDHVNCYQGADNGPGVSCAVEVPGDYSHTYNVVVENIGGTSWRGTLVDTVTGSSNVIGEWTLPDGAGKITPSYMGFVEYYTWNGQDSHTCDSLPFTEATFYNPTSNTEGASGGNITKVYEYGDCIDNAGYSATQLTDGYDIKCGFW